MMMPPSKIADFSHALLKCKREKNIKDLLSLYDAYMHQNNVTEFGNDLVSMLVESGNMSHAQKVFDSLTYPHESSWNKLITGYVRNGNPQQALFLYQRMEDFSVPIHGHSFVALFKACSTLKNLPKGQQLHADIVRKGLLANDAFVASSLIDMYVKCGNLNRAHGIFDELEVSNVVCWTALIQGYVDQGCGEQALNLFTSMRHSGVSPNSYTFVSTLKACAIAGTKEQGKELHMEIIATGLEKEQLIGNSLINFYAKCGLFPSAQKVLDEIPLQDVVTWTSLLAGYVEHDFPEQALYCYEQMQRKDISLNPATCVCILKACGSLGDPAKGQEIHSVAVVEGIDGELIVGNTLIDMYMKCNLSDEAKEIFDKLKHRDVISWTALISGYAEQCKIDEVLYYLDQMQEEGTSPNLFTLLCSLKACNNAEALSEGRRIHVEITKKGLEMESLVGNTLLDIYVKCGSLATACYVFEKLPDKDIVSWNAMIMGYTENGFGVEALLCFNKMQQELFSPSILTFMYCFKACCDAGTVEKGHQIHAEIIMKGLEKEQIIGSTIVLMYAYFGSVADSQQVFDQLLVKDIMSFSAIMTGYVENRLDSIALDYFEEIKLSGISPNADILLTSLRACSSTRETIKSHLVHSEIVKKGLDKDLSIVNSLIDMYAKWGLLESAQTIFYQTQVRDVISWNVFMSGCVEHCCKEKIVVLLEQMEEENFPLDTVALSCGLKACSSIQSAGKTRDIHMGIIKKGNEMDLVLASSLVDAYAKSGLLGEAKAIFDKFKMRDTVLYNVLISGYFEYGSNKEALHCIEQMIAEGIPLDAITLVYKMKICNSVESDDTIQRIHAELIQKGLDEELSVGNALVDVYARSGLVKESHHVFEKLKLKDVVLWNALISGYIEHGHVEEVLISAADMKRTGISPDLFTLVCSLRCCFSYEFIDTGREIHSEICSRGLESDLAIASTLIDMYAKHGSVLEAQHVFNNVPEPDIRLWTGLISGYTENQHIEEAERCINLMLTSGLSPNKVIFICSLKIYSSIFDIKKGMEIHADIVKNGLEEELMVANTLMDMYNKFCFLPEAVKVFNDIKDEDVVSWNVLIAGYAESGYSEEPPYHIEQMEKKGIPPDNVTYVCSLKACSSTKDKSIGQEIHARIIEKAMEMDPVVSNTLVDMYVKCGSFEEAHDVFDSLKTQDAVSWNVLLAGYAENGKYEEVFNCFIKMQDQGTLPGIIAYVHCLKACSNLGMINRGQEIHTYVCMEGLERETQIGNALVYMYSKHGLLTEAEGVFNKILIKDMLSWNTLIAGYLEQGLHAEASNWLKRIQDEGVAMSSNTIVFNLKAIGSTGAVVTGQEIHVDIVMKGLEMDVILANTLIDMYVDCGFLAEAQKLLDKCLVRTAVTWNVVMAGYAQFGMTGDAFHIFHKMIGEGINPDTVTLVSLLNAFSHAGLVGEGYTYFHGICSDYGITPELEHYNCLVDLLTRAGCMDEAVTVITHIPFHPGNVVWHTMLGASRKWGNVSLGKYAFSHAMQLNEMDAPAYVCISNIYANASEAETKRQAGCVIKNTIIDSIHKNIGDYKGIDQDL